MRKPAVLGLLGLFASLVPAFAGTVYVPVAPPQKVGEVTYRTQVVVSNPGGVARRLETAFIASGRDGTKAGAAPATVTVPAHGTLVLGNVTRTGREGMLEISGDPQLAVSARLEGVSRSGRLLSSAPLPVIGSDHVIPGGGAAQLQGIGRTAAGIRHHFGLLNLGLEEAACTLTAYRAGGTAVGAPVRFTAPPLSHNTVAAPLAAFGSALFTEARVEVSCDSSFYTYAVQLSPLGAAAISVPSVTLDSDLLKARDLLGATEDRPRDDGSLGGDSGDFGGGQEEEEEDGTDGDSSAAAVIGQDELSFRGVFLTARKGDSYRAFDLPLRPGVRYKRITLDFDLYLHKWVNPLFHVVTALRRNDRTLYAGLILRGDRAKTVLDLGKDELARDSGPWKQRSNYHIRLVTDAEAQRVNLQVFQGSKLVHSLSGPLTTRDLSVTPSTKMRVDFGGTKVADGAYFPPFGWKYSNLTVKAEPF